MSQASPIEVKVRMYRQGLGDCFLLTFTASPDDAANRKSSHVLIDCGVIVGTADPTVIMGKVADDILQATGGHLDLLVVTHEHWDHLSGFLQAQEKFAQMQIDTIWMAWTEDEGNETARRIRAERGATLATLRALIEDKGVKPALTAMGLDHVLGFFGSERMAAAGGDSELMAAAVGGGDTATALASLRARENSAVRFRTPGESPLSLPGLPEAAAGEMPPVRIYVLGPPLDEELLKKSDPSARASEVYSDQSMSPVGLDASFLVAAKNHIRPLAADAPGQPADAGAQETPPDDDWAELLERCLPFDRCHQMKQGEEKTLYQSYFDAGEGYRRIDDDWLQAAGEVGLKLDSDTNNTSLALAFELTATGAVLLFPGDAQVGNWLSWDSLKWSLPDLSAPAGAPPRIVTIADLLKRTILYKVGHHASHNATLREKGLERMTSGDLIALIPVSRAMAAKKRWQMPFPPLWNRLKAKTRGRVLLADADLTGQKDAVSPALPAGTTLEENDLYFEITLRG